MSLTRAPRAPVFWACQLSLSLQAAPLPSLPSPPQILSFPSRIWLVTEVTPALVGKFWNPRLADSSAIISKAGNQVSSQSSEVYNYKQLSLLFQSLFHELLGKNICGPVFMAFSSL